MRTGHSAGHDHAFHQAILAYSQRCHVSPDGKRLATAAGDGYVRIWSTDAIINAADTGYTEPKQLSHMSYHSGTIHTVRFSPNGRWLASGADDKVICIYHLDTNPPSHSASFGTNEQPPVENWKILKRLLGHDNDVQDLGWAYDNSIMVSVGLDSKIVVWSGHTFEKLKTISVHQSMVKGITFDPANKYFATASDDRTIRIFRFQSPAPTATPYDSMNNFVLEHTIAAPFTSSPLTTYFRRCSWSPEGNHIAAANAVNGPVSSVAIINRGQWDGDINLIGHEGPTEVCAFSPRLFSNQQETSNAPDRYNAHNLVTVIACAGQDKTLSIWNTSTSRPVVVVQDVAGKSISDLAWSPDGITLFASSLDGSIVSIRFAEGELGYVAPWDENDKALAKYGANRKGAGVVEDVAGFRLEEQSKASELRGAEGRMGALMGDSGGSPAPTINGNGTSTPMAGVTATTPTAASATTNGQAPADQEKEKPVPEVDENAEKLAAMKQRVTITKEGKKRVAPLLVSSSGTGQSSLPQSQLMASSSSNTQSDAPQTILDLSKPYDGLPRGGLAAMLLGNKRKAIVVEEEEEESQPNKRSNINGPIPIMINGVNGAEPAMAIPPQNGILPTPEFLRPAVINPIMSVSQVRLAVPKVRTHILRSLDRGTSANSTSAANGASGTEEPAKFSEDVILEAQNPEAHPAQIRDPSRISATKRGALLWQDFLPRAVILVTGNKNFWSAACEDGSIYAWTPAGRRLLNAMVVESQPVIIECRKWWLLCVTSAGMCHIWNLKTLASPHPPVSLAPILEIAMHTLGPAATTGPGVTSAHLNSNGNIIITLSNGDGYLYSPTMYVWQRLSEAWWAVGSQYWNSNDSSISSLQSTAVGPDSNRNGDVDSSNISAGIIPHLERHTTNEVLLKGRAYHLQRLIKTLLSKEGFEGFESGVSIAHLENRVAAAMQLGARDEFRIYLYMYAKRLGAEGLKNKVEELLRSILGGILKDNPDAPTTEKGEGWQSEDEQLCGWDRKELLKGVVLILGKFRDLQRLVVQYARVLGMVDEENGL
ncbi:protein HIR [Coleophoma crateriformis]|uniref:Protein HIR n=1 Tax=Coleophoma crateriformis TaxID=565419 RepID=A0A3D8RD95_9HELO|nr:protein HIR [Coleophoma crateriformis]